MMLRRMLLLSVAIGLCTGVTCRITGGDGGNGTGWSPWGQGYTPLDETDAAITITQDVDDTKADVVATITDSNNRTVDLDDDQSVDVNDVELSGPNQDDEFTATIDVASKYTVTVTEPTRGVESTSIDVPADFKITSPTEGGGASLRGFTLEWSNADERLQVRIRLSQTIDQQTETVSFGTFTDTGSRQLELEDLGAFVQDAPLYITVTKINTRSSVAGFNSAALSARVSVTSTASPRP